MIIVESVSYFSSKNVVHLANSPILIFSCDLTCLMCGSCMTSHDEIAHLLLYRNRSTKNIYHYHIYLDTLHSKKSTQKIVLKF